MVLLTPPASWLDVVASTPPGTASFLVRTFSSCLIGYASASSAPVDSNADSNSSLSTYPEFHSEAD